MTKLKLRFYMHTRRAKGGYTYVHQIIDGETIIGWKSEGCETRNSPVKVTYALNNSDQFFDNVKDFAAAYEAAKEKAA